MRYYKRVLYIILGYIVISTDKVMERNLVRIMLELYNTTNDVKRIPKYKYNGKYVIPPHGSVKIDEEQAYFFKPYARVGIVVRRVVGGEVSVVEQEKNTVPQSINEEPTEKVGNSVEETAEDTMEEIVIDSSDAVDTFEEMEEIGSLMLETEEDIVKEESVQEPEHEDVLEKEEEIPENVSDNVDSDNTENDNTAHSYTADDLVGVSIGRLRDIAKELNIDISGIRKKILENL